MRSMPLWNYWRYFLFPMRGVQPQFSCSVRPTLLTTNCWASTSRPSSYPCNRWFYRSSLLRRVQWNKRPKASSYCCVECEYYTHLRCVITEIKFNKREKVKHFSHDHFLFLIGNKRNDDFKCYACDRLIQAAQSAYGCDAVLEIKSWVASFTNVLIVSSWMLIALFYNLGSNSKVMSISLHSLKSYNMPRNAEGIYHKRVGLLAPSKYALTPIFLINPIKIFF